MSFPYDNLILNNILTSDNYMSWRHNLMDVPKANNYSCVFIIPRPPPVTEHSIVVEIQALKDWIQCDDMAKSYVLASLDEAYTSGHYQLDDETIISLSPTTQTFEYTRREVIASLMSLKSKSVGFINQDIGDTKF